MLCIAYNFFRVKYIIYIYTLYMHFLKSIYFEILCTQYSTFKRENRVCDIKLYCEKRMHSNLTLVMIFARNFRNTTMIVTT